MGISANFNINDIDATFKALLAEVDRQLIESLTRVGEEAVKLAKMIPPERGFKDRTGNLRSSIGYVVLVDGKPVNVAFAAVKGGHAGVNEGTAAVSLTSGKQDRRLRFGSRGGYELRRSRREQRPRRIDFRRKICRKGGSQTLSRLSYEH